MAQYHHNYPIDHDDDESANSDPRLQVQARAQIPFDDFVNAMDVMTMIKKIHTASGDEKIRNAQLFPRLCTRLEANGETNSPSESESEAEVILGIKRRRLFEDESEDNKEQTDSDSISPQYIETKQRVQKLAPVLGKGQRYNKKAAIGLVGSRITQKLKDYNAMGPELDEDHIKTLMERSRVDLTPFSIVMLPRIVDSEKSQQIGGLVRNLVAAQHTGIMAIESIFKKVKEEAAERMLDKFEPVSQAIGEAQQL
ncbi:MAG: hypothetical protein EZS28_015693 [Streblomastix strix]|uniref:Uncharacterized protein n=1 Tax=Streblomastix strix TaxID=222440 RepID=A0A5J4W1U9_9EUKA|nr:MAG: hypothetical protein EZS28_015693 [Streblomastix strix]